MAAAGHPGEDAGLYEAVKAVGEELCPALGLTIPVGKDSMSMKTRWRQNDEDVAMTSPLSLVVTAFARVEDVRGTVTPQLRTDKGDATLLLIDLGEGRNALGATALAQVYRQLGDKPADVRNVDKLGHSLTPFSLWSLTVSCWPITIALTGACWSLWLKWRLPGTAA